jgi:hypothetical protein
MKTQVNPILAAVVIVVALGVAALLFFSHASATESDTQLPPEVVKRLKAIGPQPMPPMPMPGGGIASAPGATQNGAPVKK